MFKYIKMFFLFLLPIVRKAAIEVAADTLSQAAYPDRRLRRVAPGYHGYNRYTSRLSPVAEYMSNPRGEQPFKTEGNPHAVGSANWHRHKQGLAPAEKFHDVLMVAFDITGPNRAVVEAFLMNYMPETGIQKFDGETLNLDSYWIADDDSEGDLDSVVFVSKGNQEAARGLLREHGLVG